MADLLETIQRQIDARLEELRPFAEEATHLERARDAMDDGRAQATRRAPGRRSSRQRADGRRGEAAGRVIDHVAAHPGVTAADVAAALGLKRNSVATQLTRLTKQGKLVKASRGYAVP